MAYDLEEQEQIAQIKAFWEKWGTLITGVVGLDGVSNAFAALRDPEQHAKILIDPKRAGTDIQLVKH